MPGPDGIPAMAYKKLGPLAVDTLFAVFKLLSSEDAEAKLVEAYSAIDLAEAHAFNESILCCLPKKSSGVDTTHGNYYCADATRPLNISNVDNRIITSAARIAWEPLLESWISNIQRGFLKNRVMLHNIIEIDWAAMTTSLRRPHGTLVLFDFRAAFPSVSHDFLVSVLTALGVPEGPMRFIRAMYNNNTCVIRIASQDFAGFPMLGGVRQGCPLSPLLFAVCVDILLRKLAQDIPKAVCKAFADDIGVVVQDWWTDGPIMHSIFTEFAAISNLHLNINKTLCIPLWPGGVKEVSDIIATHIPNWARLAICDKGTYLGFSVGPGKGDSSWEKPWAKYCTRVDKWAHLGAGMQFGALSYNVFALSTLLYVAHLEKIPKWIEREERKQVLKIFPGPGAWLVPEDAWYLKESYGLALSAQPLTLTARASQLRVACLGCHFSVKDIRPCHLRRRAADNIFAKQQELKYAMTSTHHRDRIVHWSGWYERSCCKVLTDNFHYMQGIGIGPTAIYKELSGKPIASWDGDDMKRVKKCFQRATLRMLKAHNAPQPVERIRQKTDRWRNCPYGLTGHPGLSAPLIHKHLSKLAKLTPPRIRAAVFKSLWNGWATHRRFQQRMKASNICVFGCSQTAEDSIEHYCRCEVACRAARQLLHISYAPVQALDIWTLNSAWLDNDRLLVSIAILIYGVYNAFNTIRHNGSCDSDEAYDIIRQHCIQATLGHPACMNILDSAWSRPMSYLC